MTKWIVRMPGARSERGAVAVMTAGMLLVLMAFASLALDSGLVYMERRQTQTATDNAALAAAYAVCQGADPALAAYDWAERNGYPLTVGAIDIDVDVAGDVVTVKVSSTKDTALAGASSIGVDEVTVVSEASASCRESAGTASYAFFAGASASACETELNMSTGGGSIIGDVHTNGDLQASSAGTSVTGSMSYGGSMTGSGYTASEGVVSSPEPRPYPVPEGWQLASYAPGGVRAQAAGTAYRHLRAGGPVPPGWQVDGSGYVFVPDDAPDGLYFVEVDVGEIVTFTKPDGDFRGMTIVSANPIQFAWWGSVHRLSPFEADGLTVLSTGGSPCEMAVQVSTSQVFFDGVAFAPAGLIQLGTVLAGQASFVGATINLSGSVDVSAVPLPAGSRLALELTG